MVPLETPLSGIRGIPERFALKLKKLGLVTVRDLLWHFPSRYEDFSTIYPISDLQPGQHATVRGAIEHVELRRSWQKRMAIVSATVTDESGSIRAVWFNQPYLKNTLKPGRMANFSGKVTTNDDGEMYLANPAFEILKTSGSPTTHTGRLVPIYPETRGLTSKGIRFLVQPILKAVPLNEWIPEEILNSLKIPGISSALRNIHFPKTTEDAAHASRRFSFEDLFLLQLWNFRQRQALAKEKAPAIPADIEWVKQILGGLPFALTESQKRALWEIVKDISAPSPMNRLLQGDVGSGKTAVAALAALLAAKTGYQTAFMAPTEVLAHQHFETLKKLFRGVPAKEQPAVALLTSQEAKKFYETDVESETTKPAAIKGIAQGDLKIIIGTHALIQKSVSFNNLGLVIVDEQHRFGVRQRAELLKKNAADAMLPHFLSMSATPIPRTLMMTVFGDLDVSLITELPAGRKPIETRVVAPSGRTATYKFIREEIKNGRQAFVICPRIEKTESVNETPLALKWDEARAVKDEYEKLSKKIFPDLAVGMLHGKMRAAEKEKIMKEFRAGTLNILVSTSVIEVGVDVPNATIMMIEDSERFGLAQLYQFRGRVGRGEHQSYCLLFTNSDTQSAKARLKAIAEAKNGFELAERDLKLRGPGQFLGEAQSGLPDIAMESLTNQELVKSSRDAAKEILEKDPELKTYIPLRDRLEFFVKSVHLE